MKFARAVVKARVPILILAVVLLVPALIGMAATRINYDMLTYLPKDMVHIAHRIVNYKQLEKLYGVIVISIDERLLEEVMRTVKTEDSEVYLTDENGRIISCTNKSLIGTAFTHAAGSSVDQLKNGILGWNIIRIHDNSRYMQSLLEKLLQIVGMGVALMLAALFVISKISGFNVYRDI